MYAPIDNYQSTQVGTASPERLLLMLYDGAIRFSRLALEKMQCGDIAGKGMYIGKALAIVSEFQCTLNHDVGGEIARNLERLYVYIIGEFTKANINNDIKPLENAISILTTLRDTWTEAVAIARKERSADNADQRIRIAG